MSGFALLADLKEEEEDEWKEVGKSKKQTMKEQQKQQPKPAQASISSSSSADGAGNSSTNSTDGLRAFKEAALKYIKQEPLPPQQEPQQRTHDTKGRPMGDDYYRAFQCCFVNERTGDVVLRFHKTEIVKIKGSGEVILTSGGYLTLTTMLSMNDALHHVGIKVWSSGGDIKDPSSWSISWPHAGSMQYEDDVVIPSRSAADRNRASTVAQGLKALGVPVQVVQGPGVVGRGAGAARAAAGFVGPHMAAGAGARPVGTAPQPQQAQAPVPVPAPSPAAAAPRSYATRLAANINRQKQLQPQGQQQRQQGSNTAAAAAGSEAGSVSGGGQAGSVRCDGEPQTIPAGGPAESAACSACLTTDAYLKFLSPTDYTAGPTGEDGAGVDMGGDERELGGGLQGLTLDLSNLNGNRPGGLDEDDSLLCVMCMERPQETILIPCSHAVLCAKCVDCLMQASNSASTPGVAGVCPICRTEFMEFICVAE